MKRKARMGIVTNKMSDEVYHHLEQKAKNNELSQYIIQLVEKDLQNNYLEDQFQLVQNELENVYKTIHKMKGVFQTQENTSPSNDETLVNLELVSDDEIKKDGFDEAVDLDF